MKVFIPMRDDMLADPTLAALPLVPFCLDFDCLRDMDAEGRAVAPREMPQLSGESPLHLPA